MHVPLLFAVLIVFIAYFLKGFSGFGPALVLIPVLSVIFSPGTAISASAFFDIFAGLFLLITVFRQIDWRFVLPVTILLMIGAYPGAYLLKYTPVNTLKILIASGLLLFIALLILTNHSNKTYKRESERHWLQYPIALFSGFTGGLIGITGPVLIVYLKFRHGKDYFRTQLIAVFFFGALWRFILYRNNNIEFDISPLLLIFMGIFLIVGLYYGHRIHLDVDEKRFNRIVAGVLLIPVINLFYSGLQSLWGI